MPYNSIISRTDADALIPDEVSKEIIAHVPQQSAVMQLARRLPNMSRAQKNMPVMSALATAYFVTGDTSLKQTTEVNWESKYINAEELAVIVPIPEAVLDDADFDIWGEVRPQIEEAFGIAIDQAVLYGTNIPASWTTNLGAAGLIAGIASASQDVSLAGFTDVYEAILGESGDGNADGLFALIEADGFMVTGSICHTSFKAMLRNLRSSDGVPLFTSSMQGTNQYQLDGAPCLFPTNGAISATYYAISGQWSQLVYAMRQDITYKVLTEAVIQDAGGNIVYNLAQQDMIALRAVMRLGFALPNPINRMQETEASRFPFAYLSA
jgi:HK97 family phage major capsid protein